MSTLDNSGYVTFLKVFMISKIIFFCAHDVSCNSKIWKFNINHFYNYHKIVKRTSIDRTYFLLSSHMPIAHIIYYDA